MTSADYTEIIDSVKHAGERARLAQAAACVQYGYKAGSEIISEMDETLAEAISERIHSIFPNDRIICEDAAGVQDGTHACWYVDSIDGTTNYVHGSPFYAVVASRHIGEEEREMFSIIHAPALKQTFLTIEGHAQAFGVDVLPCQQRALRSALISYGLKKGIAQYSPENQVVNWLNENTHGLRRSGCAALDICYTASGHIDAYFHFGLNRWDVAAGIAYAKARNYSVCNVGTTDYSTTVPSIVVAPKMLCKELALSLSKLKQGERL